MSGNQNKHISKSNFPTKTDFLSKYEISEETFKKANITWRELKEIYLDYLDSIEDLERNAEGLANNLLTRQAKDSGIHSVRYRVKSPEGLIEKIIRKRADDENRDINLKTYKEEITDLIGIRALHVFKQDWYKIHHFVVEKWKFKDGETPTAHFRKGDPEEIQLECEKTGCVVKIHEQGYRSIHYVLEFSPTKNKCYAELQVRTIFEEGWSEIDHKLRYISKKDTVHPLQNHLSILNRIAGSADEMGILIKEQEAELQRRKYKKDSNGGNNVKKEGGDNA